jgi:hypothetical protein
MRIRCITGLAADNDIKSIQGGEHGRTDEIETANRHLRMIVTSPHRHRGRSAGRRRSSLVCAQALLRRLEYQFHCTCKPWRHLFQYSSDSEQSRCVNVMAAPMHQAFMGAGERQSTGLLDRPGIHIGPDCQHLARPSPSIRPTTPVLPMPVWCGIPSRVRSALTMPAVRTASNPSSGCVCHGGSRSGAPRSAGWPRGWRWPGRSPGYRTYKMSPRRDLSL